MVRPVAGYVPSNVLHLDQKMYHPSWLPLPVKVILQTCLPKIFLSDEQGNLAIVDFEDILAVPRQNAEQAHWLLRPFKKFKFKHAEQGAILKGLAKTGLPQKLTILKSDDVAVVSIARVCAHRT